MRKNRTVMFFLLAFFWLLFGLLAFDGEPLGNADYLRLVASGLAAVVLFVRGIRQWQIER
ncbi:MAG: hypothetical protein GY943_38805 [Chloroflexi bacterium]|nr:hypothetical protein [Chloroflexota bacterium]